MHNLEKKALNTIRKYGMITKKDRILCAVSGGKDSTVLLDILHRNFGSSVEAVNYNSYIPGYSTPNLNNLKQFCRERGIKLHVISMKETLGLTLSQFKEKLNTVGIKHSYCTICGILKRSFLNRKAHEMGFTKVATGHNLDDVSQSILMNLLRGTVIMSAKLVPISGTLKDTSFVPRIKPLYFIREEDIKEFSKESRFPVIYDPCPYSEEAYRRSLRTLMREYLKVNPRARENLVNWLLSITPRIEVSGAPNICKVCGSPSAGEVCSQCRIIGAVSNKFK